MGAVSVLEPGMSTRRHEALLRAASVIANCEDCDATADVLVKELQEVIPFDYLHVVAFENDTNATKWQMLYANSRTQDLGHTDGLLEGSPIRWVHESQQLLVTPDWRQQSQFPGYGEFLGGLNIAS